MQTTLKKVFKKFKKAVNTFEKPETSHLIMFNYAYFTHCFLFEGNTVKMPRRGIYPSHETVFNCCTLLLPGKLWLVYVCACACVHYSC